MTGAVFHSFSTYSDDFKAEVLKGLSLSSKAIPFRFLYDMAGSWLFDRISQLEEYYLTRSEYRILLERRDEIARLIGPDSVITEYGPGNGEKSALLLAALENPRGYIPIDVSGGLLFRLAEMISRNFPGLPVQTICADLCGKIELDKIGIFSGFPKAALFLGSTIGNLEPEMVQVFLTQAAAALGPGSGMVIGVDLLKSTSILEDAYNDALGVTSQFNLNLLTRINRELCADIDLENFYHHAMFNSTLDRIEMRLVSRRTRTFQVGGLAVPFKEGEVIHTESSYKYTIRGFQELVRKAGWTPEAAWTDEFGFFSVHFLRAQ